MRLLMHRDTFRVYCIGKAVPWSCLGRSLRITPCSVCFPFSPLYLEKYWTIEHALVQTLVCDWQFGDNGGLEEGGAKGGGISKTVHGTDRLLTAILTLLPSCAEQCWLSHSKRAITGCVPAHGWDFWTPRASAKPARYPALEISANVVLSEACPPVLSMTKTYGKLLSIDIKISTNLRMFKYAECFLGPWVTRSNPKTTESATSSCIAACAHYNQDIWEMCSVFYFLCDMCDTTKWEPFFKNFVSRGGTGQINGHGDTEFKRSKLKTM